MWALPAQVWILTLMPNWCYSAMSYTQTMLQQKKSRQDKWSWIGAYRVQLLESSTFYVCPITHPLCVISQSQEALNSQSLHWSSQKSSLTHTLTSFQPCLLGTPPTHHLLMLFHVSTQPNHLPIWCTFLPSCFSYQNLSFFSWMNLPSMSSSNFLWHGNHQYWNS